MSINQSRAEKSESSLYRRLDRSGQQRNLFSGSGKGGGGGTGPPPSSSSLSSNRSFRKSNNAQGGSSRASGFSLTSDSNNASAAYTVQNGAHAQTPLHGASDAPVTGATVKPNIVSTQRGTRVVPKVPSSNAPTVSSDTKAPTTPAKGDAPRSLPLQFGSINPGFMNGMQIPARTSSAPPNLDEQRRDQACHLSAAPTLPTPSIPKQQLPRKDAGTVGHSNSGEARPMSEAKRDVQVSAAPLTSHTQKSSLHPIRGISMQMSFLQPQVPVQFGGPNPQIQSQGMTATSLPMSMPLPMGNPPQMQQQVFIPGLQPHPMQSQGIMHQGQSLNFSSQMGPHIPSQLSNLGMSITQQFPQQQAGKFGGPRRTVKITHPETHEELSFEKSSDTHIDSGSSGPRPHHNVPPQSQPLSSYPPVHPSNYYPNAYNTSSLFFPTSSSLPLSSNQIAPSSQAPRFYNQVSQGPPSVSFMNPSALNSFSVNKTGVPLHGIEHSRDVHTVSSSPSSTSVQVTVKPAVGLHGEKVNSSLSVSLPAGDKGEPPKVPRSDVKASMTYPQRDSKTSSQNSLQQSKPGLEPTSAHVSSKLSTAIYDSVSPKSFVPNFFSSAPAPSKDSASLPASRTEGTQSETVSRSDSVKNEQKKPGKKGHSLSQDQVGGKSTSVSSLPSRSLEHGDSLNGKIAETLEAKLASASSDTTGVTLENPRDSLANTEVSPGASDLKTDHAGEGMTGESLEMFSAAVIVNTSLKDEQPKPETLRRKAKEEIMLAERSKQEENSFETSSESSEVVAQTEQSYVQKVTTNNYEAGSLETAQRKLEEPILGCREDDRVAGNLVTTISTVSDAVDAEASLPSLGLSTNSHGYKTSTLDAFLSRHDSMDTKEVAGTESGLLDQKSAPVSVSSPPEPTKEVEGESTENICVGLVSPSASGSKVNPLLEPNKAKSIMTKGKKKKEILQKADAAGTTSDLYMAYKGPEEKKETVTSAESKESISSYSLSQSADAPRKDVVSSEKDDQSKAEPDDWEDAADISTPKLETSDNNGKQVHGGLNHHGEDGNGVMAKKYSRDFLLKFAEHCIELPVGFEITSDIAEVLMVSSTNVSRDSYPSPGRINDRSTGGSRQDRRGSGMGDDDRRSKQPGSLASGRDMLVDIGYGGNVVGFQPGQGGNFGVSRKPRAQATIQYAGGILSGPMQSLVSQGGMQRNNSDSDRWQRATNFQKGLIPSPHTPLLVMHKAEKKYEVGKVSDEEEAKQRQLKGILNKLTPQNFEKLFEQVKQVNIDNDVTLTGVISQIFDKALTEPTFCEMYANFCYHLAGELPDLSVGNEKITFKRLLLNKCQEEFERGVREQEEANKAEEEGEAKRSEEEIEEKRTRARRRMLGNIRLIGELYKKKMLTERIMHECIKKLLGQSQNPDEEDVEALCKLMSTIGEMIDHPKAKEHMDAYFDMMANLSNNMKLSSRTRFMLKDAIDLRKNKWQQRRKVEGPKKIEEVHRDAAQERQAQVSRLARAPSTSSSVRRSQPMEFAPRGLNMLSSPSAQMGGIRGMSPQLRGYGNQDVRWENRHSFENRILSVPLPQRPVGDDSITLGPQGGLARGMSSRGQPSMPNISLTDVPSPEDSRRMTAGMNGYSSVPERIAHGSREAVIPRHIPDRLVSPPAYDHSSTLERNMNYGNRDNADLGLDRSLPNLPPTRGWEPTFTQNVSSEKVWPEERLRDMSMEAIKEFYSLKDEKEVALCIKDLNAPSFYPSMISIWVTDSFERKDMERDLLAKLLINLTKSRHCMISSDQLIGGFESVLTSLEDAVNDAPKAAEFLGRIFAKVILENVIPLTEIGRLIYEGGEEEGRLVETGLAAEVLESILEIIKSERGDSVLHEIRTSANLRLENFRPPGSSKSMGLDKFI